MSPKIEERIMKIIFPDSALDINNVKWFKNNLTKSHWSAVK